MSEQLKWAELTPREKTERIVQDVMGWMYFPTWDLVHTACWALEHREPIPYPFAFWNEQSDGVSVFYRLFEDARSFNPLESMSDAWQIVEKLDLPFDLTYKATTTTPDGQVVCYAAFIVKTNRQYEDHYAHTAQEAICVAALRVAGLEVVVSEIRP